jgi:prepilin signal peptidase PulO-like enzyme (type II secretory pathway)
MPELTAAMNIYLYSLAAVLGLCMGSFLNCFALRYVRGESVTKGRSHCALCGHVLGPLDLVPLFSWVFLRGRCRYCGERVSPAYPLSELVLALCYISVLFRFGLNLEALRLTLFLSLLFAAALTDIYGGLIPDRLWLIGAVSALVFAFFPEGGQSVAQSLIGTLINGLSISLPVLLIVLVMDKLLKKETMGGGDIKLMFLIGLHNHWSLNIFILILACVLGLVFALLRRKPEGGGFSFGPALAVSAWIALMWGRQFVDWYVSLLV